MTDYQPLIDHIQKKITLSEEEVQQFISFFKLTKVKKRQFVIQPDFVPKYRNYVLKGALMGYVVDKQGQDRTIQLAIEDWWISDYNSYIFQQPATMFVVALENSTILQLDFAGEQKLKSMNHKFETFFRIMAERSFAYMQRRVICNLTQTAEERFHDFEYSYPHIARRVPQYVLASFLGMTTQYLSKLRNKRTQEKS